MKYLIILLLLSIVNTGVAQSNKQLKSTGDLALYINSAYESEYSKVFAAYRWVTQNIRYSDDDVLPVNHGLDPRGVIDIAFSRRKGVCENFSAIFTDVCRKMGLEAVVINGYTKTRGTIDPKGHSWSAVKFGDDWFLFDPTWDAGAGAGFSYFKRTGNEFIQTHMPFDPMWQLLTKPMTYQEFNSGALYSDAVFFNFKDSIQKYQNTDSLTRYTAELERMKIAGIRNKTTDLQYKIVRGNIEDQKEQNQMNWYNEAVALLNEGLGQLNNFITYRNQLFEPVKPDSDLKGMLNGIDKNINEALTLFNKVDASDATLVYGTQPAREQVKGFYTKYKEQEAFLSKYLSTPVSERKNLFYK